MADLIGRLELARELIEGGCPAQALRALPARGALPSALRAERDLLEAEAWREAGFFGRARGLYGRVLRRPGDAGGDPVLRLEASLGLASLLRSVGEGAAARRPLNEASRRSLRLGFRHYRPPIRLEGLLVDRALGRFHPSLHGLYPFPTRALRRKAVPPAAFLVWAVGGALRLQGKLMESEAAFRRSGKLARACGDSRGAGYALLGLAGVVRIAGRPGESAAHYERAGRLFAGTEDAFAQAYASCGQGNGLRQSGRLKEAERCYLRSRAIYSKLGDGPDLAYVEWGLGQVYLQTGRPALAGARLRAARTLFLRHNEERGAALSELSLSRLLYLQGRVRDAERLHAKALDRARRAGLHTHLEVFT